MSQSISAAVLQDAVERSAPGLSAPQVVVAETGSGAMVTLYSGDPPRLAGRIYIDIASGTVFVVPSWVPRASEMERALRDPEKRARLVVV